MGFPDTEEGETKRAFSQLSTFLKTDGFRLLGAYPGEFLKNLEKSKKSVFFSLFEQFVFSFLPLHHFFTVFLFSKVSKIVRDYPEKGPSQNRN